MAKKSLAMNDPKVVPIVGEYFGVDLHKDQITWHRIGRTNDGRLIRTVGIVSTDRLIEDFVPLLSTESCYVILEASSSSFFFYSLVSPHCSKAFVINPSAFRELYMTGKKTDKIDAKRLADRLMYHVEMNDPEDGFPEVFVPDDEALQIRRLVTTYELLVKQATQLKNQLKAIFKAKIIFGYEDILSEGIEEALKDERLDTADKAIIKSIRLVHDALEMEKAQIKEEVLKIGAHRFRREIDLLIGIPGVSIMGATVFMADVVTIDRFSNPKKLTSYLASVGKVDASGTTIRNGGLNKRGRRTSYRFILQGLLHVIHGNECFGRFVERHAATRQNKVRAAIVRKTFVAMYYMLKKEEPYRFFDERIYRRKQKELGKIIKKTA
jgi:transposase